MNLQEELKALKERIAELEELAKEEQEFPQDGDEYWYVDSDTEAMDIEWDGSRCDQGRLSIGNVFKTKEQAEFTAEKIKVEAELRKFSRPFLWGTENTAILFDGYDFKFDTRLAYVFQGVIYFESRAKAQQAIESVGAERIKKYIFGVED